MEKIEIYQYPSIFVSSQYFEYAEDLKKKIEKDRIVLEQNKTLENEIAYKTNLLTYYYLLFEGGVQTSLVCEESVREQKEGWFIWLQNYHISTSIPFKNDDEKYTYWFDKYFSIYLETQNSTIPYYLEAVKNYKDGNLFACVCCLFPIIEYLERKISRQNGNEIFKIKPALKNLQMPQMEGYKKYFEAFEKNLNDFLINTVYKTSIEQEPEPEFICRNRIMHGIFTREISKTDCLKLFCIVKSMDCFNSWINITKSIKTLSEELIELKKLENK